MTYFMKVLAAITQYFIFVNAMKGEWRCLSALQLMDIYSKKKGKESSGKNLMLTWGLFCFRIPTLYLFFGDCGKAFGFWNEMNLLCNFWGDEKKSGLHVGFSRAVVHQTNFLFFNFAEADYTLDDSFWNEESPVGMKNLSRFKASYFQKRPCFLLCRWSGASSERVSTKSRASSKDWRALLSDNLSRAVATPREDGNFYKRSWRIKGTIFFRKEKYYELNGMSNHSFIHLFIHHKSFIHKRQSCILWEKWSIKNQH